MSRGLIVECKGVTGVADREHSPIHRQPLQGLRYAAGRWCGKGHLVGGQQGVAPQQVQDIGQHQFLVLLFVLQSQFDQTGSGLPAGFIGRCHEILHGRIDMAAVGVNVGQSGPSEQAPLRSGVAWAQRLVVGVEQIEVLRIKHGVTGPKGLQHYGFKKPAGVGQMPLGRTGVGHGLHALVLCREGLGQRQRACTHGVKALAQCQTCARK